MAVRFLHVRSCTKFSLRTLFVAVALCAVWLGVKTTQARKQRQAVAALTELGVQIGYDWNYNEDNPLLLLPNAKPPGPEWLSNAIGEHYFARVVKLDFSRSNARTSDLKWLESLPHVRWLSLYGTPVANDGMKYVGSLGKLEVLYIAATLIGDGGLQHIQGLTELRELQCRSRFITDSGLASLSGLTNLQYLWLGDTSVSDAGLKHLESLRNLTMLYLRGTAVTAEGAAQLKVFLTKCAITHNATPDSPAKLRTLPTPEFAVPPLLRSRR
jgi:hypothetical protein